MHLRISHKQAEFQKTSLAWACSPTSLLTCLRILGNTTASFDQILRAAGTTRWDQEISNGVDQFRKLLRREEKAGLDEDQLAKAARSLGYTWAAYDTEEADRDQAWHQLMSWGVAHKPALLCVGNSGHWIVAYGADRTGVWVLNPSKCDRAIFYRPRELLSWWYGDSYYGASVTPANTETRQMRRQGGIPPSRIALIEHTRGNEEDIVTLRADLSAILGELPSGSGAVSAADLFVSIGEPLRAALCNWSADVGKRWINRRIELIEDLLRNLSYTVPSKAVDQVLVDFAMMCMADGLVAADVEPGDEEPEEILKYDEDATAIFGGAVDGEPASAWLARHEDLLVEGLLGWLSFGTGRRHRRRIRALSAACAGRRWAVPVNTSRAALMQTAALLVVYEWYTP